MKNKKKVTDGMNLTPSSEPVQGQPITATDLVNKYGTYEIQPTCDSDNSFPKIAQGLPKEEYRCKDKRKNKI